MSWDIELNPGPSSGHPTMYPCGLCQEPVNWIENILCCDTCNVWCHRNCVSMSTTLFTNTAKNDISWICCRPECNQPNYTSVIYNTPKTTSVDSTYSILENSMREESNQKSADITTLMSPNSHSRSDTYFEKTDSSLATSGDDDLINTIHPVDLSNSLQVTRSPSTSSLSSDTSSLDASFPGTPQASSSHHSTRKIKARKRAVINNNNIKLAIINC